MSLVLVIAAASVALTVALFAGGALVGFTRLLLQALNRPSGLDAARPAPATMRAPAARPPHEPTAPRTPQPCRSSAA